MAPKIDWYYHRKGWTSCQRAQEFLAEADAKIVEQIDSRKVKYSADEALELVGKAQHLWVSRGKSARHIDLKKDRPTDDELIQLITGPTGTLRAPAILRGKTLFVGFNPDVYETNLK